MPLSTATITYDIADLTGVDFDARRTRVWVTTNIPTGTIADTDGNQVRLGDGRGTLAEDGTGSVTVWVPGTGSNPASWQTSLHIDYQPRGGGSRTTRVFGPFTITADANLADLVAEEAIPPEAVGGDDAVALFVGDPLSATAAAMKTSVGQLKVWARNPDQLIAGTVTRDSNGAATSAPVVWPDGSPGTYTADTVSTAFPGAVDAYHITYGSPVTKTYTQPTITRDATGAATNVPAIVVS